MQRTLFVVALVCAWPATGLAQDTSASQAAFEEAERQFRAENYQLALDGYTEAQRLAAGDHRIEIYMEFNRGRCLEQLRRWREALQAYERYLAEAPADAPVLAETRDRARDLRERLRHEPPVPDEVQAGPPVLAIAGWSIAGLGAASLIASVPLGVIALDNAATLEEECPGGRCSAAQQDLLDETRSMSLAADALWIAGVGLAAVGVALVLVDIFTRPDDTEVACGIGGCFAGGRF